VPINVIIFTSIEHSTDLLQNSILFYYNVQNGQFSVATMKKLLFIIFVILLFYLAFSKSQVQGEIID